MAIKTNDELFVKEFKEMMLARQTSKGVTASSYLQYLRYPEELEGLNGLSGLEYVKIKGIPHDLGYDLDFTSLNDKIVQIIPVTEIKQKQRLADNTVARNSKGEVITKTIKVPKESVVIVSTIKVRSCQGKAIKETEAIQLVDVKTKNQQVYFVYFIPKVFVYRINLCSLVVTPNKQRKFYKGYCVALTTGVYMYIFVVPYKEEKDETKQVLSTKASYNFDKTIDNIFKTWIESNIMFNPKDTKLEDGVEDTFRMGSHRTMLYNIGIMELEPTLLADDYRSAIGESIAQQEKAKADLPTTDE